MYAPFSLVRAVLENTCAAVWMLQPPQQPERLTRPQCRCSAIRLEGGLARCAWTAQ